MDKAEKLRMSLISQNDQLLSHYKDYLIGYMNISGQNLMKLNSLMAELTRKQLDEKPEPYSDEDLINCLTIVGYLVTVIETKHLKDKQENG